MQQTKISNGATQFFGDPFNYQDQPFLSFLDSTPDSILYNYVVPFDKLKIQLSNFNLTPNESKVFIYLGKYGSKTAIEISKTLRIPRTEVYRALSSLQNKGIAFATFDHPTRFSSLAIDNAIDTLLEAEFEKVKMLRVQKSDIVDLWQSIPLFSKEDGLSDERFQMIKGQNSIIGKINEIFADARKSLLVFGPERFYFKLYHSGSLDLLSDYKGELRILTSCLQKSAYVFTALPKTEIRSIPSTVQNDLCFVVKDDTELISFVKSDFSYTSEILAIRTNCSSLIYTMTLLFNQIWSGSHEFEDSIKDDSNRLLLKT